MPSSLHSLPPDEAYRLACEMNEVGVYGPWMRDGEDWVRRSPFGFAAQVLYCRGRKSLKVDAVHAGDGQLQVCPRRHAGRGRAVAGERGDSGGRSAGGMTLQEAAFRFTSAKHGVCRVRFEGGDQPKVIVWIGNVRTEYDNAGRHGYRPCVTHCLQLIRRSLPKHTNPASEFDRQRRKRVRDKAEPITLKVVS